MFSYQESSDKKRSGWIDVENGEVIISLKKSGALERERYVVCDIATGSRLIKRYIETGETPDFVEIVRMV